MRQTIRHTHTHPCAAARKRRKPRRPRCMLSGTARRPLRPAPSAPAAATPRRGEGGLSQKRVVGHSMLEVVFSSSSSSSLLLLLLVVVDDLMDDNTGAIYPIISSHAPGYRTAAVIGAPEAPPRTKHSSYVLGVLCSRIPGAYRHDELEKVHLQLRTKQQSTARSFDVDFVPLFLLPGPSNQPMNQPVTEGMQEAHMATSPV